jgi:hypothetical protein
VTSGHGEHTGGPDAHGHHAQAHGRHAQAHRHDELSYLPPGTQPVVHAVRADVAYMPPAAAAAVAAGLEAFVRKLRDELAAAGCVLVGHVKGTLDCTGHGGLTFSLTSLDGEPRVAASLRGDLDAAVLTLNVIVFGVAEDALPALVSDAWDAAVPERITWRASPGAPE